MILNDRQFRITSKTVRDFTEALKVEIENKETPEWLHEANVNAIRSQIDDLQSQIKEYELLKSGQKKFSTVSDLQNLPLTMIQARIAQNLTQADLAFKIGLSEQQIQRYESSGYKGASLSRLIEITKALGIQFQESWSNNNQTEGDMILVWQDFKSLDWRKFPLKEMIRRKWLEITESVNSITAVQDFFLNSVGQQYATALYRKKYHGKHAPDEYSLLAWQARVIYKAKQEFENKSVVNYEKRDDWLSQLVSLSLESDSLVKVKDLLLQHGIILIIEEHLPGTYLDGAAMKLDSGNPVIALTLRYDRLDHFWFVLFHELAHVFLHIDSLLGMDYFDESDSGVEDSIEKEADKYAMDTLISEQSWKTCISRFLPSDTSVISDATRLGIHPSIIAGRIRKEKKNYTLFNSLIGLNTVRKQFGV